MANFKLNALKEITNKEVGGYYPRNSLIVQMAAKKLMGIEIAFNRCVVSGLVKKIGRSCFRNNNRFEQIYLSEGVEAVEPFAFWGALAKTISIPRSLKSMKPNAFSKDVLLLVCQDSYAERYAIKNGLRYQYSQEN